MYQALYRKWRPRTFDDVVGQSHITDTLTQQVSSDRLSHAYLFTGTRGTGKTSCAKILSRATNCLAPINGNPCNSCTTCQGIENGSILDVLELDAASNNGVDQVRALRDEAVYTPASTRKRVYIVDEVHMLSTPAFNALLKILEEPPPHLLFILATTELHKVPATIRSRCQQFAFKRILPEHIATRLMEIAPQENIDLTREGAALLARLADGGLRDGLSLLDQCAVGRQTIDVPHILDILGLAGNLETVQLMEQIVARDVGNALATFARLYGGGKDIGSVLGELSSLCRDLLLQKTAPKGSALLLTGGYDDTIMNALGQQLPPQRILYMLKQLQSCTAALPHSSNRRTDGELCLIRLCDEALDDSPEGLSARIAQLEQRLAGVSVSPQMVQLQRVQPVQIQPPPVIQKPNQATPPPTKELPPWDLDDEYPPLPEEPPFFPDEMPLQKPPITATKPVAVPVAIPAAVPVAVMPVPTAVAPAPVAPVPKQETPVVPQSPVQATAIPSGGSGAFWTNFATNLKKKVPPSVMPYLTNPAKVAGTWQTGVLTLWVDSGFTKSMLNKAAILEPLTIVAEDHFGTAVRVAFQIGSPPPEMATAPTPQIVSVPKVAPMPPVVSAPQVAPPVAQTQEARPPSGTVPEEIDKFDELLTIASQFDNITIQ